MKRIENKQAEALVMRKKRHNRLRRGIALLSALVVFLTMNSLKLSADALSRIPMCGLEEHVHGEACYDAEGALVCELEEHEHTDACYQQRPVVTEEPEVEEEEEISLEEATGEVAAPEAGDGAEEGAPDEVFGNPQNPRTKSFLEKVLEA